MVSFIVVTPRLESIAASPAVSPRALRIGPTMVEY